VDDMDDDDLLEALGVSVETKTTGGRTPRQERVIAGFEDILNFVKEQSEMRGSGFTPMSAVTQAARCSIASPTMSIFWSSAARAPG
jgi:hypothetical protein